jgi:tetratricopeptide (TPR) repeat protein
MKFRVFLLVFISTCVFTNAQENQGRIQGWGDGETAQKYVEWIKKEMDEGRWSEALAAAQRAADFSNVSSDISYQQAFILSHEGKNRNFVIKALDRALEINRWVIYNENQALLFKANQLVATRKFTSALAVLEKADESADAAVIRLLALRGMAFSLNRTEAYDPVLALSRFRSQILTAMDRYSRDPRPLRIFFEYARNTRPVQSELAQSDHNLLELAIKRLPFLLEADPELAWLAAPFMRDTEQAKRYVSTYRAGSIPSVYNRDFMPSPPSIAVALNMGLLDDARAVEELFSGARGINYPLSPGIAFDNNPVLDANVMNEVFSLLRGEEGRDLFMQKLLSFTGTIISDDDNDDFIDSKAIYKSGVVMDFAYDVNQTNEFNWSVMFSADGVPVTAWIPEGNKRAVVQWERYPSVRQVWYELITPPAKQASLPANVIQVPVITERFFFRPADFQYAPVDLIIFAGSKKYAGPAYPVLIPQYLGLTRKALVSFCSSIQRPSIEFDGATEELFLEKGIITRAVETSGGKQISVTEFERGSPVVQRVDMDMDGRMETIRRFYRSDSSWSELDETFNYRRLIASSESDWTGQGKFKTGEVYQKDGSVVYSWDMDGSGDMNYSENEKK